MTVNIYKAILHQLALEFGERLLTSYSIMNMMEKCQEIAEIYRQEKQPNNIAVDLRLVEKSIDKLDTNKQVTQVEDYISDMQLQRLEQYLLGNGWDHAMTEEDGCDSWAYPHELRKAWHEIIKQKYGTQCWWDLEEAVELQQLLDRFK